LINLSAALEWIKKNSAPSASLHPKQYFYTFIFVIGEFFDGKNGERFMQGYE